MIALRIQRSERETFTPRWLIFGQSHIHRELILWHLNALFAVGEYVRVLTVRTLTLRERVFRVLVERDYLGPGIRASAGGRDGFLESCAQSTPRLETESGHIECDGRNSLELRAGKARQIANDVWPDPVIVCQVEC